MPKNDWLRTLSLGIPKNGAVVVDTSLDDSIKKNKDCLAITHKKDRKKNNVIVGVTSLGCDTKQSVICSMDASKFTPPQKLSRFPCIRNKIKSRSKRQLVNEKSDKERKGM